MQLLAYIRVSTERQKKQNTHLTQIKAIETYTKAHDYEIVEWYQDLGTSGKDIDNRPQFKKMRKDIQTKADGIIAYSLSRLSRDNIDLQQFIHFVTEKNKKQIIFTHDKIDTSTPAGRFFLRMLAITNQYERERIAENTEIGRIRKKDQGGKIGGPNEVVIPRSKIEKELKRGNSPERIAKLMDFEVNGKSVKISGKTIRRRMSEWGIYNAYLNGEYRLV